MSDQDFFFDEDEQPKAADKGKAEAKKSAPAKAAASAPAAAQSVTTTVAALIGVIALLAGLVIGILLPVGGTNAPPSSALTGTGATGAGTGGATAPQLSPEQMQGGELPQGHPDISSMGGGAAGSGETSGTEGEAEKSE